MSSAARLTTKKLYAQYPALKQGVEEVKREVFGQFPQIGVRTGYQKAKKPMTGVYLNYYYPDHLAPAIRKYDPSYRTELEERREAKRSFNKRRGKGPPKKGSGKQKKK